MKMPAEKQYHILLADSDNNSRIPAPAGRRTISISNKNTTTTTTSVNCSKEQEYYQSKNAGLAAAVLAAAIQVDTSNHITRFTILRIPAMSIRYYVL